MKVSLNLIKKFTPVYSNLDDLVHLIGSRLGAVENVTYLGELYENLLVVKVVECTKHKNADKLSVCLIDDGGQVKGVNRNSKGLVQVVCGAPNVAEGKMVVWLPPGSKVPSDQTIEISTREFRGEISNGMLASPKELTISEDHEGLLIIEENVKAGYPFKKLLDLDDVIIELENKMFTHRPDCFGILGVAREIAGITHQKFKSPDWYLEPIKITNNIQEGLNLDVENKIPKLVPRFMAQVISNVQVTKSSLQLQSYLSRLGVRPINNIVDLTNYYMLITAQPLHAYDYDKLLKLDKSSSATITIRHPEMGESLSLLNGKTIKPTNDSILIASSKHPIGLGGVMGGAETEVDHSTKNIILECATFDMYSIRRSSMSNGIFTDAVTRFNKSQSPLQNDKVLAKTTEEILKICGGNPVQTVENKTSLKKPVKLNVNPEFISSRLGVKIIESDVSRLLQNVEFYVDSNVKGIEVVPPFWRTDIEIKEDIVEEVGRLYGFDRMPLNLPSRDLSPGVKDNMLELKKTVRQLMSSAGSNEVLTYNFIHGGLIEKVNQEKSLAYKLTNALSPNAQYLRLSIIPSLLEKTHPNIKAGFDEFNIFEMNKSHIKGMIDHSDSNLPIEINHLGFVIALEDKLAKSKYAGASYYLATSYVSYLLGALGVNYKLTTVNKPKNIADGQIIKPFEPIRSACISTEDGIIGVVGEPNDQVKKSLKLPNYISMAEIDLSKLEKIVGKKTTYKSLSHYPSVEQDVCLRVENKVTYEQLFILANDVLNDNVDKNITYEITPVDIYQSPDSRDTKQITLHLNIASYEKTLTTKEVNELLDKVSDIASKKLSATRV